MSAPKNPLLSPRFADFPTFSRLPYSQNLKSMDVAIIGIPFDGGTTYRPGARFGPRGIRQSSCLNRNANPVQNIEVYENLKAVDFGDINCNPLNLKKAFNEIESVYQKILSTNVLPIGLGGDHSIMYPILRTFQRKFGRIGLVQFDAHSDTADQAWGEKFHHGTPVRRLIEDGLIKGADILQIGIRGPLTSLKQNEWDKKQKIHTVTIEDFNAGKLKSHLSKMNKEIPYYLSFDVDGVDPAFAPGTGTPVVGGLTSVQALSAVRALKDFRFVGFDVVEVAPIYDVSELTTLLASALVFEFMSLAALKSN